MPLTIYLDQFNAVAVIHGRRNFPDRARAAHFARRFLPGWAGPWFVLEARATRDLDELAFRLHIVVR